MFYRKKISNITDKEKERLLLYFPILSSSHGEKKRKKPRKRRNRKPKKKRNFRIQRATFFSFEAAESGEKLFQ